MIERAEVALPAGPVALPLLWDRHPAPQRVVALAHGAGAGPEHPFLAGFAAALRDSGAEVVRFPFPYRAAGRRMPGPAAHAEAAWVAVARAVREVHPGLPFVAAGKSYGGRMASMAAASGAIAPDRLVYLGYPLHPPGAPEKLRVEHLPRIAARQLFLSGTADPFVQPASDLERAVADCPAADLRWVPGGHSFDVAGQRRDPGAIGADLAAQVADWLSS